MKDFFRDIIFFTILIFTIAIVGDYVLSTGLRKTTIREFAVWNDIHNKHNLDNNMVFIGASSCWAHYNPYIFDSILNIKTYNLGIDGHPWYPCQPLRYNTYCRYADFLPEYIIINIDMATLGPPLIEPYEREQFFPYFFIDDSLVNEVITSKEISIMDKYLPLWRYIGYRKIIEDGTMSYCGKNKFEDDGIYKGHRGNVYQWDRASLKSEDSVTIGCHHPTIDSLVLFIKNRKKQGQQVILVKTPIYKPLQDRFTNKKYMCDLYDSISTCLNIPLLDYWDINITNDSTYFCNPTHLNKKGANYISTIMATDLKNYLTTKIEHD